MTTLRKAAESMYRRIMVAHEEAISKGDPHQWWHDLEAEWRTLGAALDAAKPEAGAGLDDVIDAASDAVLQQGRHRDPLLATVPRAAMNALATAVNAYNAAAYAEAASPRSDAGSEE